MLRIAVLLALFLLFAATAWAEDAPLIPRRTFFGNPDRSGVRLSPDGSALSFVAPLDGVLNVWVAPRTDPDQARAVTHDRGRGVLHYFWAYDNRHLVYLQDEGGNEDWHVFALDLVSGKVTDLTPIDGIAARIQGVSHKRPHEILVGINDRNPRLHDLYLVDLRSGERELVMENEGFLALYPDDDYRVRLAARMRQDGGMDYVRPAPDGGWEPSSRPSPWKTA